MVEIQSLVHPSHSDFPRRASLGMDLNRLHLLLAIIEKHRLRFSRQMFIQYGGESKPQKLL